MSAVVSEDEEVDFRFKTDSSCVKTEPKVEVKGEKTETPAYALIDWYVAEHPTEHRWKLYGRHNGEGRMEKVVIGSARHEVQKAMDANNFVLALNLMKQVKKAAKKPGNHPAFLTAMEDSFKRRKLELGAFQEEEEEDHLWEGVI